MGRAPLPHLLALVCGFALAVLVATGCGGDRSNLIPSQRADELVGQLDALKEQIDAGDCDGLTTKLATFHDDATSLSGNVDSRLRARINDGVQSLQAHAADDCDAAAAAQTETQTTDTTPTETTTTTETQTTQTDTTPTTTTTTPTDTTPTTTTPPTDTGTTTTPDTATTPSDGGDGGTGDTSGDGSAPPSGNGGSTPPGEGQTP
ncbi:MAG TPA: hypothetical protein VI318_02930 [Baekduia sp.]